MHVRTKNGATAALLACRYARVDVLRWLLSNGGASQLAATDGTSAFAVVARELGQPGISSTSADAYRQVLEVRHVCLLVAGLARYCTCLCRP